MIGGIIGDVVGSIYEFLNNKTKDFPFFDNNMEYTDDFRTIIVEFEQIYGFGRFEGGNAPKIGFCQQIKRFFGFAPKNS